MAVVDFEPETHALRCRVCRKCQPLSQNEYRDAIRYIGVKRAFESRHRVCIETGRPRVFAESPQETSLERNSALWKRQMPALLKSTL